MYGLGVMGDPAGTELRSTLDPHPTAHRDGIQIADRGLEAPAVIDGHAQHPGDGTGEGDDALMRSANVGAARCREVDTPVT